MADTTIFSMTNADTIIKTVGDTITAITANSTSTEAACSNPNWLTSSIALVLFIGLLATSLLYSRVRRRIFEKIGWVALCVFAVGIGIYMIGFNHEGNKYNILVLFLRSTISSIEMFMSESDLIEVSHEMKDSPLYMTVFSITHFLAVFVSAIFILRLFGLRLLSMARMWWHKHKSRNFDLYVFWGVNEKSMVVAESLAKREMDKKDKKTFIVFVNMHDRPQRHSSRFSFSSFFHTMDEGIEEYIERIDNLNSCKIKSFISATNRPIDTNLSVICNSLNDTAQPCSSTKKRKIQSGYDVFKVLGLNNLRGCILKSGKTEFFFLSDDGHKNIENVCTINNLIENANGTKQAIDHKGYNISAIYCHARENRLNQSVINVFDKTGKIHLIDSSLLAVLQLKKNKDNQPINFVDYDATTGTVSSIFTALIIGFGETGRDMLRFLYEFSSFVKGHANKNIDTENIEEQDKKIYVVDPSLDAHRTNFVVNAPALKDSNSIQWRNLSTKDLLFWEKLKDIINHLNYVVVVVENDEEAASLAIQLFEFAHCYRDDLRHFKIFVRLCNSRSKRLINNITKYNIKVDGQVTNIIEAFGTIEEIFTYQNISKEAIDKKSKDFANEYNKIYDEISIGLEKDPNIEQKDEVDEDFKKHYQDEQNRSNVWHIYTKLKLAGISSNNVNDERRKHLIAVTKRDANNNYPNLIDEADKKLFDNLAFCEHLRWNAKMELLGFVYGKNKSMRHKTHNCLLSCNALLTSKTTYVANSFIYDKAVVELSFRFDPKTENSDYSI